MAREVYVLGGGASGLAAAIAAARCGAKVTVLEHAKKSAQKLLATGSGKCNLGNRHVDSSCYHCEDLSFVETVLSQWSVQDTVRFFTGLGVYIKNQDGYFYPQSSQASAVRDVLLMEAAYRKVKIKNNCQIERICRKDSRWRIHTPGWTYEADALILATGSSASNIPGADGSGYALAASVGHTITQPLPALVPLVCDGVETQKWSGVRMEGRVTLLADGQIIDSAEGELQMTDYGISGIPVFQISGPALRRLAAGQRVELLADLMPQMSLGALSKLIELRRKSCPYKSEREQFIGLLPDRIIHLLPETNALSWLKGVRLRVKGGRPERFAQVMSGGVDVSEIDPGTMKSRLCEGLYFAGEVMDVDGLCGGYNLHWAWATGAIAGENSAGQNRKGEAE